MEITNAKYEVVEMRYDTFTFPIVEGTPVSKFGVLANDSSAIGIIPQTIEKKPLIDELIVLVGGEVESTYNYDNSAKSSMNGIKFYSGLKPYEKQEYTPPNATKTKRGVVKMAAKVTDATSETIVTQFNALIDSLIAAGVLEDNA